MIPNLKSGVDLQLQDAFMGSNWALVSRLAEKRAKQAGSNQQYYEILKKCVDTQIDAASAEDKVRAIATVYEFLKGGTPIRDHESMDLLDWACQGAAPATFFEEAIGPLRARMVVANPKDLSAAVTHLNSCLLHWDLVSAQQIAAVLDKNFPKQRKFFFWNIVLTYLLSESPQCPSDKRNLYRMLASRQAQRACTLSDQAPEGEPLPMRGIQTEEEILLLQDILEAHGTLDEMKAIIKSSHFGPLVQLQQGRKELFQRYIGFLSRHEQWEDVYSLIHSALSQRDDQGQLLPLASDLSSWLAFITAASRLSSDRDRAHNVNQLIDEHMAVDKLAPIYTRILSLAKVEAVFTLQQPISPDSDKSQSESVRVTALRKHIASQFKNSSCFEDIKPYIEKLAIGEAKSLVYSQLPAMIEDAAGEFEASLLKVLCYKLRFLVATCPQSLRRDSYEKSKWHCGVCDATPNNVPYCVKCIGSIVKSACALFESLETNLLKLNGSKTAQLECLAELSLILATCCIKVSGLKIRSNRVAQTGTVRRPQYGYILLATLVLERQRLLTPKSPGVLLLLIRSYILLGCDADLRSLWATLEVKRTTVESLGPIFADRLSSISPSLVADGSQIPAIQSHYASTLVLKMPRRLLEAFESESYTSILRIPMYIHSLRTSCTMVMSYVEEMRSQRSVRNLAGTKFEPEGIRDVVDETDLHGVIDYGSFPALESSRNEPLPEVLSLGPMPSNKRSHLALLTEQYFAVLMHKPLSAYKAVPSAAITDADRIYIVESLARINNSFHKFLIDSSEHLTPDESLSYRAIALLSNMVAMTADIRPGMVADERIAESAAHVETVIHLLIQRASLGSANIKVGDLTIPALEGVSRVLATMTTLHSTSHLRDVATAACLAATYILERNSAQPPSQKSQPKPLAATPAIKALHETARNALSRTSTRLSTARAILIDGTNSDLAMQTFALARDVGLSGPDGQEEDGGISKIVAASVLKDGRDPVMRWGMSMVKGWRGILDGWQEVKWTV